MEETADDFDGCIRKGDDDLLTTVKGDGWTVRCALKAIEKIAVTPFPHVAIGTVLRLIAVDAARGSGRFRWLHGEGGDDHHR